MKSNSLFSSKTAKKNTLFQSFINKNINGINITIDSSDLNSNQLSQINIENYRWNKLMEIIKKIHYLLSLYASSNFIDLGNILNFDYYNEISVMLYDIRLDPNIYPTYESVRITISKSFEELYQSYAMYGNLLNDKAKITQLQAKVSILDNLDKLKEYIIDMQKSGNLINNVNITAPLALVKPEYAEYIILYGLPPNLIFDTDKLSQIIEKLKITSN